LASLRRWVQWDTQLKRISFAILGFICAAFFYDRLRPSQPIYLANNAMLELHCYANSSTTADYWLIINSIDKGVTADVRLGSMKAKLKFVRSSMLLVDYYSNNDVELSLDPEGRIRGGVFGDGLGTCAF
jgi:hypothetical protein